MSYVNCADAPSQLRRLGRPFGAPRSGSGRGADRSPRGVGGRRCATALAARRRRDTGRNQQDGLVWIGYARSPRITLVNGLHLNRKHVCSRPNAPVTRQPGSTGGGSYYWATRWARSETRNTANTGLFPTSSLCSVFGAISICASARLTTLTQPLDPRKNATLSGTILDTASPAQRTRVFFTRGGNNNSPYMTVCVSVAHRSPTCVVHRTVSRRGASLLFDRRQIQ